MAVASSFFCALGPGFGFIAFALTSGLAFTAGPVCWVSVRDRDCDCCGCDCCGFDCCGCDCCDCAATTEAEIDRSVTAPKVIIVFTFFIGTSCEKFSDLKLP